MRRRAALLVDVMRVEVIAPVRDDALQSGRRIETDHRAGEPRPLGQSVTAISSNEPWPLKRGLGAAFTCMTKSVIAPLMRNGNGLFSSRPLALACARMKASTALASRSLSIATERQSCVDAVASKVAVSAAAAGQAAPQSTP